MTTQALLDDVYRTLAPHRGEGNVASYIPALARIDPSKLGMAIATIDGELAMAGDGDEPFSIQSISKTFTLTLALDQHGDDLWQRVGREPSGSAFNSIVQLEAEQGIPRNPLINAGAIATCDALLANKGPAGAKAEILDFARRRAGAQGIEMDPEVAQSEAQTGFRNTSLANFMKGFGNLHNPVADVLDVYFHQCAIAMSCAQLGPRRSVPGGRRQGPDYRRYRSWYKKGQAHQRNHADMRALRCLRRFCLPGRPARKKRGRRRYSMYCPWARGNRGLVPGLERQWQFPARYQSTGSHRPGDQVVGLLEFQLTFDTVCRHREEKALAIREDEHAKIPNAYWRPMGSMPRMAKPLNHWTLLAVKTGR